MNKHTLTIAIAGLVGGAAASVVAPRIYNAYATVPAGPTGQLWYAGALVQGTAPLTGKHDIQIALFADTGGSTPLGCSVPVLSQANLDLTAGHFRVDVSACATALQAASTAYVRVTIDPGTAGEQLFPSAGSVLPQIGAVPYAIEALTAKSATTAATATSIAASPSSTRETFVRATIPACGGATPIGSQCTIASQLGVQSAIRVAAGYYTVTFTQGTFATAPTCVVSSVDGAGGTVSAVAVGVSKSGLDVALFQAGGGTTVDDGFHLICMGPQGP